MKKANRNLTRRFFIATVLLLGVGLLTLYSASSVQSFRLFGNPNHMALHQLMFGAGVGLVCLFIVSRIPYQRWQRWGPWLSVAAALLMLAVHLPGVGVSAGGATRWIVLGQFSLQPGEVAKLCIIIYAAGWLTKGHERPKSLSALLPLLVITAFFAGLLIMQPDMGTAVTLCVAVAGLIFLSGVSIKNLAALAALGAALALLLIKVEPYRAARLMTFLNPGSDPLGAGYQLNQALTAVGSGGTWGFGYGLSRQKHNYLPEAIGDSIFAVVGEELGFIRVILILSVLALWLLTGLSIAARAPDTLGRFLAGGIVMLVGSQALINIGATIGLLPLTGIPLPFFSYGSSALVMMLIACGIMLNIARNSSRVVK